MAVTATATTASIQEDEDLDEFNPQAKLIKALEVSVLSDHACVRNLHLHNLPRDFKQRKHDDTSLGRFRPYS